MRIPKYFYNLSEAEQAEWIKAKKEKENARRAKWRAENPEKAKAQYAKYRAENLEKIKAHKAKYNAETRSQKSAIKFFQMTQAISEIANINTEKK